MSVKGKVKRANKKIAELEYLLKDREQILNNFKRLSKDYEKLEDEIKIKDNILKQLVIKICGSLNGGMNLMVDSCVNDINFRIDEDRIYKDRIYGEEFYTRNQKCYTIRIQPKWR